MGASGVGRNVGFRGLSVRCSCPAASSYIPMYLSVRQPKEPLAEVSETSVPKDIIIVDDTPNPERLSVPFLYALDISVIDVIGDNGADDPILRPNAGLADCCSN